MKRHLIQVLVRLLLAIVIAWALPYSHLRWGQAYPSEGQQAFGFIIAFLVIGFGAAAVFVSLGSLGQFLLRKRSARFTVFTDLALLFVFTGVLIYGGVSARYQDTRPNKARAANPAMTSLFHAGRQWRGVADARRSP